MVGQTGEPVPTTIDHALHTLTPTALDTLWAELKPFYERHFDMVFSDHYLRDKCQTAASGHLRVLSEDGAPVGVLMMYSYQVEIDGTPTTLYRASAAVDAAHRSRTRLTRFMYESILPDWFNNLGRAQYILEAFVHPSSYSVTQKNVAEAYPSPDRETPPDIVALMEGAREAGLVPGYDFVEGRTFLADAPVTTRQTPSEAKRWAAKAVTDPYVRFFAEQGAHPGRALFCVVPVSFTNLARSAARTLWHQSRLRLGQRAPAPLVATA